MVKYICKNTGSQFSSEGELKDYLFKLYGDTINETDDSNVYDKLKIKYPDFNISMRNGDGWYTDVIFELSNDKYRIVQYYGNNNSQGYPRNQNPSTYEELAEEIDGKFNLISEISNEVFEKYDFKLEEANYTYGYSEDEHSYEFVFLNGENRIIESYYPYKLDHYDFIHNLKQYVVTCLEGSSEHIYDDGYFAGYTIDGIDISIIMKAKKVKLEIIE